mgnify:CR=1 FL=1
MRLHHILAIGRAERYSPNSVEKDAAILACVCHELARAGHAVETINETQLGEIMPDITACITMGRNPQTLERLDAISRRGVTVVNSQESVRLCCQRRRLDAVLRNAGICVPSTAGCHGYWLKRADGTSEGPGDIRFAADAAERNRVMENMRNEGMGDIIVSAHIPGDLLKFYGVRGTGFFRTFYPGDDGQWKFSDEEHNGRPHHYAFSMDAFHAMAEKAAQATDVIVYGGDAIINADGQPTVIDFNDWPSFSRCRDEAASAIAKAFTAGLK